MGTFTSVEKKVPKETPLSPQPRRRKASSTHLHPQVERSRDALRHGLLSLLGEKSIDQITHQELVATAQVGYATYYRHYASKDELLNDLVRDQISKMMGVSTPIIDTGDFHAACLALCQHVDDSRKVWKTLLKCARAQVRDECIRLTSTSRPRKSQNQTWIPVQLGVQIGVASMLEIITWLLDHPKQFSVEMAADVLNRMVVMPAFGSE